MQLQARDLQKRETEVGCEIEQNHTLFSLTLSLFEKRGVVKRSQKLLLYTCVLPTVKTY